jgi:uncharacterized membrane protein
MSTLRRYLIAGLLIWVPLGVTLFVIQLLVGFMDKVLLFLPDRYRPDAVLGFHVPGLGLVLTTAVVLVTGMLVANFFGRRLIALWESLLARIPLVRSIYTSVKQVTATIFSTGGNSFRKVLLIQYPRLGLWTIAFHTGTVLDEVRLKTGHDVVNVFVPTTPNPTSGFFLIVPRNEVIELEMSIEEAEFPVPAVGCAIIVPRPAGNGR